MLSILLLLVLASFGLRAAPQEPAPRLLTAPGLELSYPPGRRAIAISFLNAWPPAVARVGAVTGVALSERVTVELVPDAEALSRRLRAVTGEEVPGWVAGVAISGRNLIIIRTDLRGAERERIGGILTHELCHIAVGALARQGEVIIPRWLNEGLAQYAEGRSFVEEIPDLAAKAFFGSLIPLSELDRDFPHREGASALAYAQAESFVRFLARFSPGTGVPRRLLEAMGEGLDLDAALQRVLFLDLETLESRWHRHLRGDRSWVLPFFGKLGFGLLLAVAVILGASRIVRRREQIETEEEDDDDQAPWFPDDPPSPSPQRRFPPIRSLPHDESPPPV